MWELPPILCLLRNWYKQKRFTKQVIYGYYKDYAENASVFLWELKYMFRNQCQVPDIYGISLAADQKENVIIASC